MSEQCWPSQRRTSKRTDDSPTRKTKLIISLDAAKFNSKIRGLIALSITSEQIQVAVAKYTFFFVAELNFDHVGTPKFGRMSTNNPHLDTKYMIANCRQSIENIAQREVLCQSSTVQLMFLSFGHSRVKTPVPAINRRWFVRFPLALLFREQFHFCVCFPLQTTPQVGEKHLYHLRTFGYVGTQHQGRIGVVAQSFGEFSSGS
mmetsp:Transcript_15385/g.39250  ORF Transcript_15385/g.39250 Transcript_15385/m.39250 type:complete len:203 (+) Transcript_15385:2958-3566(+)